MASRNFLVLIAIALIPFAIARQNPSDKEAHIDLTQKDGLYEPLGRLFPLPPKPSKPHICFPLPATAEGTDVYETSGIPTKLLCSPPPPGNTSPPPTSPVPTPAPTPAPTSTSPAPTPSSSAPTPTSPAPTPTSPAPTPISTVPAPSPGRLAPSPAPIAAPV